MSVLEVTDLHAGYGRLAVVNGISLRVADREALALLGPNGHGKTTALRCVAGLHRPRAGTVVLRGEDVTRLPSYDRARRGLAYIPQGSTLFPGLTVRENLWLAGQVPRGRRERQAALERVHDLFPPLARRSAQRVGTLSGGERQMVAIGMGLMANPSVLILDEPTLGLAPKVRWEILDTLIRVRGLGLSLVVADGDIDFLFALADRWQVVELGRVVAHGDRDERPSEDEVMAMYLGANRD
jgi:branched-chain amino acid transport system ATP-binding protein